MPERPIPSILRGFSAPVRLDSDLTESDLFFLLAHDSDEFNRYAEANSSCFAVYSFYQNNLGKLIKLYIYLQQLGVWAGLGEEADAQLGG